MKIKTKLFSLAVGQGVVEYALLLLFVALLVLLVLELFGISFGEVYCKAIVKLGGTCNL